MRHQTSPAAMRLGSVGFAILLGISSTGALAAPAEAAVRSNRKISVSPIRPSTGVAEGAVIVYGHYVPPPYHFSYDGASLMLNGVQVEPSLVEERNFARFKAQQAGQDWHWARFDEIQKEFGRLMDSGATKQQIMDYVLAQSDLIADAKWESDTYMVVRVKLPYGRRTRGLSKGTALEKKAPRDKPRKKAPPPDLELSASRQKEKRIAELTRALRGGLTLIFLSENGVYRTRQAPSALKQVLTDTELDADGKLKALKELLPASEVAADDMVLNFELSEWHAIRTE